MTTPSSSRPNPSSRNPSAHEPQSQQHSQPSSDHEAALRGASIAFGKPALKPKPRLKDNTYAGGANGALAAATRASPSRGGDGREGSHETERRLALQRSGSGGSTPGFLTPGQGGRGGMGIERDSYFTDKDRANGHGNGNGNGNGNGLLYADYRDDQKSKNPSFIAAALAASRSVTPNHTGQSLQRNYTGQLGALQRQSSFTGQRRPGSVRSVSSRSSLGSVPGVDTSSVPPTGSLIGMFEENVERSAGKKPGVNKDRPVSLGTASGEPLSPKPKKPLPIPRAGTPSPRIEKPKKPLPDRARTPSPRITKPQQPLPKRAKTPPPQIVKTQKPDIKSPKPTLPSTFSEPKVDSPALLPAPRKPPVKTSKPDPPKPLQATRKNSTPPSKPIPIPSARPPQEQPPEDDASSDDSFVSANEYEYRPSFRAELQSRRRLPSSQTLSNEKDQISSLANAIVASSLASSRAASPSKTPSSNNLAPPPPPRRNHLFHSSPKDISRTPSPSKPSLRTTMRKPREEEEDEREKQRRRGKKNLMKKHPNKHHEGDRKRWRDEVTERERKRYEAVWASNRGLHINGNGKESMEVCNLIVRDIYSRSRLGSDVLEEVYALVDREQKGMLGKEEFVVGLWLVDQRLKGRKLPIRVSESVWRSVGILGGIKVRKAGKR